MYAKEESLRIFQGAKQYIVHENCNSYNWSENSFEKIWYQLTSTHPAPFLGTICFKSKKELFNSLIIDGQDKLIILSLIIKCLLSFSLCNKNKIDNILKDKIFYKKLILKDNMLVEEISSRIELLPFDQEVYEAVLYDEADEKSTHPIICAYKYSLNKVKNATESEINNIITKLSDNQCNLFFVFTLNPEDNEERYFNILNDFH